MQSGSNLTRLALAEELIPHPLDQIPICFDDPQQLTENSGVVAIILGYSNFRFQPEVRFHVVFLDVNMHLFTRRALI